MAVWTCPKCGDRAYSADKTTDVPDFVPVNEWGDPNEDWFFCLDYRHWSEYKGPLHFYRLRQVYWKLWKLFHPIPYTDLVDLPNEKDRNHR